MPLHPYIDLVFRTPKPANGDRPGPVLGPASDLLSLAGTTPTFCPPPTLSTTLAPNPPAILPTTILFDAATTGSSRRSVRRNECRLLSRPPPPDEPGSCPAVAEDVSIVAVVV
jgi:hypothetical protein